LLFLSAAQSQITDSCRSLHSDAALKNYALIPVMTVVVTMMVVGVIGVIVTVVVVAIVMMVVTMMITVPSCGWSRTTDCDCADDA
jgi:hypothetical protein